MLSSNVSSAKSVWRFLTGSLVVLAGISITGNSQAEAQKPCLSCHEGQVAITHVLQGIHGTRGEQGCLDCHGESTDHRAKPAMSAVDRMFGKDSTLSGEQQSGVCLDCHNRSEQKHWTSSEHATADISCSSCHKVHVNKDPALSMILESNVCGSCHTETKSDAMKFSHHPLNGGIMSCSSCHNPHGGKGESMLVEATVNETCFQCHADKRGPQLFEHEPVQDNCLHCHTPHGSVNDNLLTARSPLLCQQCHIAASHPGTSYINDGALGSRDNRLVGKSCLNCHGQVHGSNHPAGHTFRH